MDIEAIRRICTALPAVTEGIKWGNDLCFMVGEKMFCVASLQPPLTVSFKVNDEEFEALSRTPGIIPAPYAARYKWVMVQDLKVLKQKEWQAYIAQSYHLIFGKLSKKVQGQIGKK